MKKLKITRYADPAHSWFKVPRKLLAELGIEANISSFSYQLGDFVYLEEDCDFGKFLQAYMVMDKVPSYNEWRDLIEVKENHTNRSSKVRSYPRFIPNFKRVEFIEGKRVKLYGKEYTLVMHGTTQALMNNSGTFKIKPSQFDEMFPID